jgi:hypothetical protein
LLPRLDLSQLVIQPFARFPKQLILFLKLLQAPAKLRIPSSSLCQVAALPRNSLPCLFVPALKVSELFFQPRNFASSLIHQSGVNIFQPF